MTPYPEAPLQAPWFEAGQQILATDGYAGLKLAPTCRRVGVTTGAFYHAFGSWQEFTDALLEHWRRERTTLLVALARDEPEPVARLRTLAAAGTSLMHRTEAAIRVWAAVDPRVRAVQRRVDDDRYAIVLETMAGLVGEAAAERFAVWAMSTLVGYEMLSEEFAPEHLAWALDQVLDAALAVRR